MTTIDESDKKTKTRFWVIALVTLVILAITTTTADILDTNNNDSAFLGLLIIPSMPGFLIYVVVTGDIHGWQPGPIGQSGRIIVMTLGSWIFWTPLIYWIYKRRLKKKDIR
jgi:hypothetical protein